MVSAGRGMEMSSIATADGQNVKLIIIIHD